MNYLNEFEEEVDYGVFENNARISISILSVLICVILTSAICVKDYLLPALEAVFK